MQRDRRKRYSPARHPVLLRRVLLVLCILAVLWLGYSCMMPQLLFSARGTMIFVPDPPAAGVAGKFGMPSPLLWAYSAEELFKIRNSGKSADFPELPFHGRGRGGKQHLQRRFLRKRGAAGERLLPRGELSRSD